GDRATEVGNFQTSPSWGSRIASHIDNDDLSNLMAGRTLHSNEIHSACAGCMKIVATAAESRRIARMRRKQSTKTRVQILHTELIKHLIYTNNPPYPSWGQRKAYVPDASSFSSYHQHTAR
ncbi:MAG: hypothetical protein ACK5IB_12555, partial [Qingshengfaniella sp.]